MTDSALHSIHLLILQLDGSVDALKDASPEWKRAAKEKVVDPLYDCLDAAKAGDVDACGHLQGMIEEAITELEKMAQ